MKKEEKKTRNPEILAHRKSCKAEGTGLSHYILIDEAKKK
jgi:modified peptide precursor CbpA